MASTMLPCTGIYLLADGHVLFMLLPPENSYTVKAHQFEIVSQRHDSAGVITSVLPGSARNCPQTDQQALPLWLLLVPVLQVPLKPLVLWSVCFIGLEAHPLSTGTNSKPSPKTFDAGIAMYVGMALTSVASSAVVIGKKKEF